MIFTPTRASYLRVCVLVCVPDILKAGLRLSPVHPFDTRTNRSPLHYLQACVLFASPVLFALDTALLQLYQVT